MRPSLCFGLALLRCGQRVMAALWFPDCRKMFLERLQKASSVERHASKVWLVLVTPLPRPRVPGGPISKQRSGKFGVVVKTLGPELFQIYKSTRGSS